MEREGEEDEEDEEDMGALLPDGHSHTAGRETVASDDLPSAMSRGAERPRMYQIP